MADPAPETKSNPIADLISTVMGTGSTASDPNVSDAKYMLALLQPKEVFSDDKFEAGAEALYERWFDKAEVKLAAQHSGAPISAEAVQAEMAQEMIVQMSVLNGGKEISEIAQTEINKLLRGNDADGFAEALMTNREGVLAHLKERRIAMKEDPPRQMSALDGIMAIIASGDPALGKGNVDNVDVSPAEIAQVSEYSVFKNVYRLNGLGNGADSTLAMIEGKPRENWGAYNKETGGYANLGAYGGPVGDEAQKEFWNGAEGYRITKALEDRGVVSFSNDEARDAWVKEMADVLTGDDPATNGRELTERMREFAQDSSAITMESEVAQRQDNSLVARLVNDAEGDFLTFTDPEAQQAFTVEVERLMKEHGENGEYANLNFDEIDDLTADFVAEYNSSHSVESGEPPIIVNHDAIDARKANFDAVNAERAAVDPVCAGGVNAYLLGESGVACIATAEHAETPQMPAVNEVGNELRAVPRVEPGVVAPVVENNHAAGPS